MNTEQVLKRLEIVEQRVKLLENALVTESQPIVSATSTDHPLIIRVEGVRGGEPVTRHAYVSVRAIIKRTRLGETPELIRQGFAPYLSFAEISDALSYYLHHAAEVDGYVAENQTAWEQAKELSHHLGELE